ncbi:UNVERIFIED_CONTAM: 5'-methylthioadenosine/S-adenosylhomocysteine nucleosidase 1 [Sesamum latifolium]|uniref:5'-methylthioadenosine/S-adenosylhomocysteine nucleosidase 1 n=1 Tax=Sesamum latifolium TaxID=2727402 RepID=A0AAW2V0S5_9LAMI
MAPPPGDKTASKVNQESTPKRSISSVLFVIAMQTEALPLVDKFQLAEQSDSLFPEGVPWMRYSGKYKDLNINILCPGKDKKFGVDCVGTVSASLLTYASVQALQPDLIINAGTAGGFRAKGASVGDVYLVSDVAFHDRRFLFLIRKIPGIFPGTEGPTAYHRLDASYCYCLLNEAQDDISVDQKLMPAVLEILSSVIYPMQVLDLYGVGSRQALPTPNLVKELKLKVGKLSTGDSLDMTSQDAAVILANNATVKDMEGAAVAYAAELLKVPVIFLKAVTDIVDGDKPTSEECLQNLAAVVAALDKAVTKVVDFINGKTFSEL